MAGVHCNRLHLLFCAMRCLARISAAGQTVQAAPRFGLLGVGDVRCSEPKRQLFSRETHARRSKVHHEHHVGVSTIPRPIELNTICSSRWEFRWRAHVESSRRLSQTQQSYLILSCVLAWLLHTPQACLRAAAHGQQRSPLRRPQHEHLA